VWAPADPRLTNPKPFFNFPSSEHDLAGAPAAGLDGAASERDAEGFPGPSKPRRTPRRASAPSSLDAPPADALGPGKRLADAAASREHVGPSPPTHLYLTEIGSHARLDEDSLGDSDDDEQSFLATRTSLLKRTSSG